MRSTAGKAAIGAALVLVLVLAAPLAASAHIRVTPGRVAAGDTNVQLSFSVPTEPADAPNGETTVLVRVDLDKAHPFASVYVAPVAGWSGRVETTTLPKPVKVDGTTVAKAVTSVVWTAQSGAGIPRDSFQNFVIAVTPIPDVNRLTMPATQQFSNGAVERWNEPMPRKKGASPQHPAPTLFVNEAPPEVTGGMSGMSMSGSSTDAGSDEVSSSNSALPMGLAIAALVTGVAGLVLGALAFLRTRRSREVRG